MSERINTSARSETLGKPGMPTSRPSPLFLNVNEFSWIWVATVGLFALSAAVAPGIVTSGSLLAMLPFAGILAIAATGQTVVIQQRGLDLSSPGIIGLAGTLFALVGAAMGSLLTAVAVALVGGALVGTVNGLLVARVGITPLVATLSVNALVIGGIRRLTGYVPVSVPAEMQGISRDYVLGVPITVMFALVFVCAIALIIGKTVVGRRFIAVGTSPRAAEAAGVPVLSYHVGSYVVAGVCFAVSGVLLAGFIGSASQTAGNDYLLTSIAAVAVGGTPFTGGRGSVIASAVAALFLAQLGQMVLALGAGTAVQLLIQVGAILGAAIIRYLPDMVRGLGAGRVGMARQ
jgi:ribose transport system permease protein